jgi:hypothetical protein
MPPLAVLAYQGAEATNLVIAEKSAGVLRRQPSIGDNDRARCARSEVAPSVSQNHRLSEHDARRCITQNHAMWKYDCEQNDLCNVTEDRMRLRLRKTVPTMMIFSRGRPSSGKK